MDVLVVGGTRFMGVHLVNQLLKDGHKVTVATRAQTEDGFGDNVTRVALDRTNAKSISDALGGRYFDVVYDSLAYCSNDVKYLLDVVKCGRYIEISSLSVYPKFNIEISEDDFEPVNYPLKWCSRNDFSYDEIKRQAESAIFQVYSHVPAVAVRFPYVIGGDDYTKRLYFYVEHIVKSIPFSIDNLEERIAFINSGEAGRFLAWLADCDFCGCINGGSYGNISISEMVSYVENKAGIKAVYSSDGDTAPYNGCPTYSVNLRKAETIGFRFSSLDTWIYNLLDEYIEIARDGK